MALAFEVWGEPKRGGRPLLLRRFADRDAATKHALDADMSAWEDIWVRESTRPPPKITTAPPPFPWTVEWTASYAYVKDANGSRIASLLGPQSQREFVAGILYDLSKSP